MATRDADRLSEVRVVGHDDRRVILLVEGVKEKIRR
jgi:hypothetical protein